MILKSYIVEKNISVLSNYFITMIYGENIGLKDEIKKKLKEKYQNSEQVMLNQDEIIKNVDVLNNHILNNSLFNNNKIIFINNFSEKLKNEIIKIAEKPVDGVSVFIFSDNLEKKSITRSFLEKNKNSGIIACYKDNEKTLSIYIREKFKGYEGLNQEFINMIIENSGFDRKILSHEIDKIKRLCENKKIDQVKLLKLLNNKYNVDFENLKDACLLGNKKMLNKNLGNIIFKNEDTFFYINNIYLRLQKIYELKKQVEKDKNIERAFENIKPKIFWKDKPIFSKLIQKWSLKNLEKAINIVSRTEITVKTKLNTYNPILIKNMLLELFNLADSSA